MSFWLVLTGNSNTNKKSNEAFFLLLAPQKNAGKKVNYIVVYFLKRIGPDKKVQLGKAFIWMVTL